MSNSYENISVTETFNKSNNKEDILKEAEALIEENTLGSAQIAVQKLATLKGWSKADDLLNKEYKILQESVEYQNARLPELDSKLAGMESCFKKIKFWKKIFVIDIFLMIISVLFSRHAIYNFYTDETMIFGMAILVGNVLVLALLLTSFIRTHLCNTKFEALSGKKIAFFADKAYFSKRIHNTEIEILNVQKYIISAELLLTDIDNIKNNK